MNNNVSVRSKLPSMLQILWLLTAGFISSTLILAAISIYFPSGQNILGAESIKTLQAVLSAAILLFIFAGHYQAAKLWAIPQESPTKRIDKTFVFTQYIFSLAFREASALTGFVLSILTGDHIWSLGSSVVVVLSIIGTAPSNTKLDALMNQFS